MSTHSSARRVIGVVAALLVLGSCASQPVPAPEGRPAAGAEGSPGPPAGRPVAVGFDLDDTLLFSSPAFDAAAARGLVRHSDAYWRAVNAADARLSTVKQRTLAILRRHQEAGDQVWVITARRPIGVEPVREFVEATFGIPADRVLFEPDGKAERIRAIGLAVFYGDADSDMEAAIEAGARPVRILRSERSSYRRNYQPGRFGEEIIPDSEE